MRYLILLMMVILCGCGDNILLPGGDAEEHESGDTVLLETVKTAFADHFGAALQDSHYGDASYKKYSIEAVREFMLQDDTDELVYQPTFFDCDDFAAVFAGRIKEAYPGIPLGTIWCVYRTGRSRWWYGMHAFNVFYDGYTGLIHVLDARVDTFSEPRIIAITMFTM